MSSIETTKPKYSRHRSSGGTWKVGVAVAAAVTVGGSGVAVDDVGVATCTVGVDTSMRGVGVGLPVGVEPAGSVPHAPKRNETDVTSKMNHV
jgi:hypothetical protein